MKGDKSLARWYKLIDHPVQRDLVNDNVRFKIVPSGRRSGKTERAKRFIVKEAMRVKGDYFVSAPTFSQVKKIYWNDLKLLSFSELFSVKPRESELIIPFPNDSTISLIGLDKPSRIEGISFQGGIVDEIADCKPDAWSINIAPALDTFNPTNPSYRSWAWIIGVPERAGDHYHDMVNYADSGIDPDWKSYKWISSDILPDDVIQAAKLRMSKRQFEQEYEAAFNNSTGRIYDDYGQANATQETLKHHEQILWTHDINFTPLSSAICVKREDSLFVLDEIVLSSAVAGQSALEFIEKFKDHQNKHVIIYGDPAGKAGEKHGHVSDYTSIEAILSNNGWQFTRKVRPSTRSIKDGQNAVRAKIANAFGEVSLLINTFKAPYCHKSLLTGQLKEGSTFLEADSEYQHIGTAIRYLVDYEWPVIKKIQHPTAVSNPSSQVWKNR